MTAESGKPWTVGATLRGFYDDNVNTVANSYTAPGFQRGSSGFEVSPYLEFSFPMEQTTISFGYVYSLKYYENKPVNNTDHYDQSHDFHASLSHAFSERYQISVKDSFVVGQEPDLLRSGSTFNTFQRISGDNLRNYGGVTFNAMITPELSTEVGYANTYYSYADNQNTDGAGNFTQASLSGLMDDVDQVFHLDLRYQVKPQTVGFIGYQFRDIDYIGNQQIGAYTDINGKNVRVVSNERNARSHYGYLGVEQNFSQELKGSIRGGARYTDYYNNPASQNGVGPYAAASLSYTYLPESYLQAGVNYDYSPSSVFSVSNAGDLTLNAQTLAVFAAVNHRITPKLYGTVLAQFQNSAYNGGTYDGQSQQYYLLGLNLQYRFTPNFSAEVGYNYDDVVSNISSQPSFDRNRVYLGVTGSY